MTNRLYLALILILSIFLFIGFPYGCSYQSVRHLNRQPWSLGQNRSLEMKYLTFNYSSTLVSNKIQVVGQAYPKFQKIPPWAEQANEIWLGTYLSDKQGQVLAKRVKVFPPQSIDHNKAINFNFTLKPQDMGSPGPVFITFGYRLVISPEKNRIKETSKDQEKKIFFASESALTRY